jgi:hypothetical protein
MLLAVLLKRLQPIQGSRLSSCSSTGCATDTRKDVLRDIESWAENAINTSSVYWIRGKMGTGKTAIARTIADRLERNKRLGCAYFVSRDPASADPRNIIRTMAFDLANMFEELRPMICTGIASLGDLDSASPLKMINALIVVPLNFHLLQDARPVAFILDGLHHAFKQNGPNMKMFLSTLASVLPWGTKLLITSLDDSITVTLTRSFPRAPHVTTLHKYDKNVVLTDVKTFYLQRFASIINSNLSSRDQTWITDAVNFLAMATEHLFLFASIVARYVTAAMHDPYERLRKVDTAVRKAYNDASVVFQPLDTIYRLILDDASIDGMNERHPELQHRLRSMLAYIVVAREQLYEG